MTEPKAEKPHTAEQAILQLIALRGPGKTICPTEAAKAVSEKNWRKLLPDVRASAVRLALAEKATIYRSGRPVDPSNFKGVYRIGLPMEDANDQS